MGYTKKGLQEQLAIAKRELADTQRYIARHEKALEELRGSRDVLDTKITHIEQQLNSDKFAERDEAQIVKPQPKATVYDYWYGFWILRPKRKRRV